MATSVFQITGASTATLQTYASTIEVYATQAQTSATNAAASATSASNSAASTGTNATTAATKATEAATSATNALASENAANTSAVNAAASATTASGHASTASTQASNAASSATTASSQATAAAASATTASSEASAAATSETNAATSATNAATSETNASTSETNAATSETNASTSASNASTSATNAANSASAASTSETNAATSESNASTSATNAASSASTASTQATNASNSATAAATSATNAASSATSAASSASTAQTLSDDFGEKYRITSSAPTTSLDVGDLYFDTTQNELKVYKSSGWAAAGSTVNGTSARFHYDITTTTNTLSGADANGNTLAYDAGYVDVFVNGVRMSTADVTTTSGNSIVFADNLIASDDVDIVAYGTFVITQLNADNLDSGTVPDARITGAYTGITNLTMSGNLTVDTSTLYVDSTNNRVGVGTASPAKPLHVFNSGTSYVQISGNSRDLFLGQDATGGAIFSTGAVPMYFSTNSTERMRISSGGNVSVGGTNATARLNAIAANWPENALGVYSANIAGQTNFAGIAFFNQDTDSATGNVADIYTNPTGTLSLTSASNPAIQLKYGSSGISGGTAALTVDGSGNVGIGTSPSNKLEVHSGASTNIVAKSTNGNGGYLNYSGLSSGGTTTFSVSHNGRVFAEDGIQFDSSGEVLDSYEEGTFTPTLPTATAYSSQVGHYTKIGNIVHIVCNLHVTSVSAVTNVLAGLPFTSQNTGEPDGATNVMYYSNINEAVVWVSGYVRNARTDIYFSGNAATATTTIAKNAFNIFGNNARVLFSCTYKTA